MMKQTVPHYSILSVILFVLPLIFTLAFSKQVMANAALKTYQVIIGEEEKVPQDVEYYNLSGIHLIGLI